MLDPQSYNTLQEPEMKIDNEAEDSMPDVPVYDVPDNNAFDLEKKYSKVVDDFIQCPDNFILPTNHISNGISDEPTSGCGWLSGMVCRNRKESEHSKLYDVDIKSDTEVKELVIEIEEKKRGCCSCLFMFKKKKKVEVKQDDTKIEVDKEKAPGLWVDIK